MHLRHYLLIIASSLVMTGGHLMAFTAHPVSAHFGPVEPVPVLKKKGTTSKREKSTVNMGSVRTTTVRQMVEIGVVPHGSVLDQLLLPDLGHVSPGSLGTTNGC
ncbi:MAG: hypothetical protein IPO05_13700 [Flavobacteriales bacterium]|jgi:hypothetical protein|nr:hypothetical protein [Flavobacteriales bacterium]MBP7449379.1 hypothetical protein [Flavobacteriales bacterium]HOZ41146.1 hypothetical protein [Flavobacteriales bacterium]